MKGNLFKRESRRPSRMASVVHKEVSHIINNELGLPITVYKVESSRDLCNMTVLLVTSLSLCSNRSAAIFQSLSDLVALYNNSFVRKEADKIRFDIDKADLNSVVKCLNDLSAYFRYSLARRLYSKKIPELHFASYDTNYTIESVCSADEEADSSSDDENENDTYEF